jgi:hypothetical protein
MTWNDSLAMYSCLMFFWAALLHIVRTGAIMGVGVGVAMCFNASQLSIVDRVHRRLKVRCLATKSPRA